jgi:hypothetical protein
MGEVNDALNDIVDLDILRPKKVCVTLAGKIINVSFIPVGITFEMDQLVRDLMKIDQEKMNANVGGQETKIALDLTIKMCALFASVEHPEMDENWFRINTDPEQIGKMAALIKDALLRSYKGVKEYGKN